MKTVFAIGAHPDDIEILMGGTLMRLKAAGYETHYMTVANGCCGSTRYDGDAIARIRRLEAQAGAAELGAVFHESVCNDLEVFYNARLLRKVSSVVRQVAPEIILTHSPADYMEDHTTTCRLVVTAAFARMAPNFAVIPPETPTCQKVTVYHAQPIGNCDQLRQPIMPDLFVDTTDLAERKVAALAKHASQKRWLDESQGLDSYLQAMQNADEHVGRLSRAYRFAEGWRRHLHLGFCGPHDDPLQAVLPDCTVVVGERP